jgi:hypothetical protein
LDNKLTTHPAAENKEIYIATRKKFWCSEAEEKV